MEYTEVLDNIALVATGLKKDAMLVMVAPEEKEQFRRAADVDQRGLSDWIRWLARNRAQELGVNPEPAAKPKRTRGKQ